MVDSDKLASRLSELRTKLNKKKIQQILAADCGAKYRIENEPLPDELLVLLLLNLNTANGTPIDGRWVSFADLPDGRFYNRAFQSYTGDKLAGHFCTDLTAFERAAINLDGVKLGYKDAAYAFHVLPRVMLAVIYHLGDEDFPPTCQVVFDASASHYLPSDACAMLGSMLTRKILSA